MSRFTKSISLFLASLPLLPTKAGATMPNELVGLQPLNFDPVQLRPLNYEMENLFAAHRSHSSHRSHASHYSSSGGGGSYSPPLAVPDRPAQSFTPSDNTPSRNTTIPYSPAQSLSSQAIATPPLTVSEKRKLQIIRVQMALTRLGIYVGTLDGELNSETQGSLKIFQRIKGLPDSGLMTTDTLNALGVMAVQ